MKHIDEFTIHRFRGVRDLKLEGLGQINLLIGDNNSGKTSVLEALSIYADPLNWRSWYNAALGRETNSGSSQGERLLWLFPQGEEIEDREISFLSTFGDGLRRVFTLASAIAGASNGLLLVDELETTIHTNALDKTFAWLVKSCIQNNVQLFATTHSLETVDAVLGASGNLDLATYRLEMGGEQTEAKRFNKKLLTRMRDNLGLEVR